MIKSISADEGSLQLRIQQLDESYQAFSESFYESASEKSRRAQNMDDLVEQFARINNRNDPLATNQFIYANLKTLAAQAGHPLVVEIVETLLNTNERQLAGTVYGLVEDSVDQTNLPYLNFTFAKYFARHRQWQQVNELLKETFSDLSGEDVNYAYLLQGSALQHLKKHRKSVESYNNIAESSNYYVHAQLNTALASIRQGWITEARSIIDRIIPVAREREDDELKNRIYLVLGYALLQKEYFRDARKAFRNIGLNSQYTNRALMGISLTAISQEDFIGGLNSANVLKQKQGNDLSSDEAYLLIPYIYERLDQSQQIAESFSEAMDYYQERLLQLRNLKRRKIDFGRIQLDPDTGDLVLGNMRFHFSRRFPAYLLRNRSNLEHFTSISLTDIQSENVIHLISDYDEVLSEAISELIDQHSQSINSYLNQSRYGLARHYDNQQQGNQ